MQLAKILKKKSNLQKISTHLNNPKNHDKTMWVFLKSPWYLPSSIIASLIGNDAMLWGGGLWFCTPPHKPNQTQTQAQPNGPNAFGQCNSFPGCKIFP
jgi:hypothetical protein